MIVQEAAELQELAMEVHTLRRSQQHGQSLAHRRQLVDELLVRARTAARSGNALVDRLGEERAPSSLFEQALSKITEWRAALDEDLGQALGGDLFSTFQDSVEKAVREIERRTTALWQRYLAEATPYTSDEILAALANDPGARTTVMRIRRLSESLRRLRDRTIPSLDEVSEFDITTAELRNAWATLDVTTLNEEVVSFLRAANGDEGAPISLLTKAVLDWLEQRGVTDRYVIRPAEQ